MSFSRKCSVSALGLIFFSVASLYGQTVAIGSVSGTVADQSGSSVPGATVRMIQTDKGTLSTANTSADGRYTFNNLPTGPYRLEVSASGFKNYSQTGIVVRISRPPAEGRQTHVQPLHAADHVHL